MERDSGSGEGGEITKEKENENERICTEKELLFIHTYIHTYTEENGQDTIWNVDRWGCVHVELPIPE